MTTATKKALYLFILPIAMITLPTMSMEKNYLQLQLENPKKQSDIIRVNCSIMIPDKTAQAVAYAMKTVHTGIFEHSNLQSTIKDPIILFHVQKNSAQNQFYVPLPAKLFINCTDKSILQIHETDGSQLFKSHPIFKKKQLLINAVCKKNPNLEGNSFAEQFNNTMNNFYENPGFPWEDTEHEHELKTAEIITATTTSRPIVVLGPYGPTLALMNRTTVAHGPNGCSNDEQLKQSIINEKMPNNKNRFKLLMDRQINGSFK